ncbi:MAG: ribonuclease [Chloroflexota bacterium]|jgi:ribonuclease-3|nr:ribonuclease [Chloroflexota bacterium]
MAPHPLEARLGIEFNDPTLLRMALTHKSAINERPDLGAGHNERLEFLGDAILGAVVADLLYQKFQSVDEGSLHNMRTQLVRQSNLADWAQGFHLGDYLLLSRGEDQRGGRARPALLESSFEAVVGAIFLDQGWAQVYRFLAPLVEAAVATWVSPSHRDRDPKSELQYRVQARWGTTPTYRVVRVQGPEESPSFTVEVLAGDDLRMTGVGASKQAAEQDAARQLLEVWENVSPVEEAS